MPRPAEIEYVANLSRVLNVAPQEVERYLTRKPFCDPARSTYLMDVAQLIHFLPPPPARVLDLGCGSGWTSEIIARCGYDVVGLDVAPAMIEIAKTRLQPDLTLTFRVADYERPCEFGEFDAAVLYDALHHAEDEKLAIANTFRALRPGGRFLSIEPGVGHSVSPPTLDVVAKFGTNEKDMPYEHQARMLTAAGFTDVRQFLRLSQLPLEDIAKESSMLRQQQHVKALFDGSRNGLTSIIVAIKGADAA